MTTSGSDSAPPARAVTAPQPAVGDTAQAMRPASDAERGDSRTDDVGIALLVRTLGDLLASLRRDAGLSQQQLGDKIGYSRATVAGAEAASRMPGESFWKLSDDTLTGNGVLHRAYRQLADAHRQSSGARPASRHRTRSPDRRPTRRTSSAARSVPATPAS